MSQDSGEPGFDAPAAWEAVVDLANRMTGASDPDVYDALKASFDSLLADLKSREAPIPPSVLAHPLLRERFLPNSKTPKPEPETPAELFGATVERVPPTSDPAQDDEAAWEPPPSTPEQIAEAENLLRLAKVAAMRGSRDEAADLLKRAEQAAPGASAVLEALGDEAAAQRKPAEARRLYDRARRADPANTSADRKHAELVFRTHAASQAFSPSGMAESAASAKSAALLSFFVPGLGQIVQGQYAKGAFFLVGVFGLWTIAIAFGLRETLSKILNVADQSGDINVVTVFCVLGAVILWFVNFADASARAKLAGKRTIERPRPPEDLPYE